MPDIAQANDSQGKIKQLLQKTMCRGSRHILEATSERSTEVETAREDEPPGSGGSSQEFQEGL